jgi:uncharacterized membrane protein
MRVLYILCAILFSLALLLSSFELTLFLFHSPINSDIIEPKAHSLTWIYLLKQKYITFIDLDIFTLHEKRHLLDVKRLFEKIYSIWIILSTLSILSIISLYLKAKKSFFLVFRYSFFIGLIVTLLSIFIATDFLDSFKLLHQLLFPQHSWVFPNGSILIEWFPLSYFQEFLAIIGSVYLILIYITSKVADKSPLLTHDNEVFS